MEGKESHCPPKYGLQQTRYNAYVKKPIIKNKYLSDMEIDEIKLKVQSKCEKRLPNVEATNNSFDSDQHHIIQRNGDIESQNTHPLQTHVNPQ